MYSIKQKWFKKNSEVGTLTFSPFRGFPNKCGQVLRVRARVRVSSGNSLGLETIGTWTYRKLVLVYQEKKEKSMRHRLRYELVCGFSLRLGIHVSKP